MADRRRRSSVGELPRGGRAQLRGERAMGPLHQSCASLHGSSKDAQPPAQESASRPSRQMQAEPSASGRRLSSRQDVWASIVDEGRSPDGQSADSPAEQAAVGATERAALAALAVEVRCIGREGAGQADTTMGRLQAELDRLQQQVGADYSAGLPGQAETVAALQAEVERLQAAQTIQRAADSALDSLQDKIAVLKLSTESLDKHEQGAPAARAAQGGMPSWFSYGSADDLPGLQEAESAAPAGLPADAGDGPLLGSPRASPARGASGWAARDRYESRQAARAAESGAAGRGAGGATGQNNTRWIQAQQQRMQAAFREAAAKDVDELRAALEQQRDHVSRLECQKQLLLTQVLRMEAREEETQAARAEASQQLAAARAAAERWRGEAERLRAEAGERRAEPAAPSPASSEEGESEASGPPPGRRVELPASPSLGGGGGSGPISANWGGSPPKVPLLRLPSDDSVAASQTMLPRIAALWEALHVPLVHRSRFFLAFRAREAFYYEAELRRLAWLRQEMGEPTDADPARAQAARRALLAAQRRLEWERKWLAQQVKWDFTPEQREEMFLKWNVHRESKQRKLQLIKRLWAPDTLRSEGGMEESAKLVMQLNGTDATDGMFDLIFGRHQGESTVKTMLATGGSMLAKMATPLRASTSGGAASPGPGPPQRRRSFLASVARQLTPRGRSGASTAGSPAPASPMRSVWGTPRGEAGRA